MFGLFRKKSDPDEVRFPEIYVPLERRKLKNDKGTKKFRIEEYRYGSRCLALKLYDKKNNQEVFSYIVKNGPDYTYDRRDYGEKSGERIVYSISPDERHISLTIINDDDNTTMNETFEIKTGNKLL